MAAKQRSFADPETLVSGRGGRTRVVVERVGADGEWKSDSASFVDPATGEVASDHGLLCACGHEFGEYVRRALPRPFLPQMSGPSSRVLTDLWAGRRLKLLRVAGGAWEGGWQVASFREWNKGPHSPNTQWSMAINRSGCVADTDEEVLENDTKVMIDGLKGAPQHNRRVGQIKGYIQDKGRYVVRYRDDCAAAETITVNVKPGNVFVCEKHDLCRVNVSGGGTLGRSWSTSARDYEPPDGVAKLISFRWLDDASPEIEMEGGVSCPTCRAIEPARAGFMPAESSQLHPGECPICMESSDACLKLRCGHTVCDLCWRRWAATKSGDNAQLAAMMHMEQTIAETDPAFLAEQKVVYQNKFDELQGQGQGSRMLHTLLQGAEDGSAAGLAGFRTALLVYPVGLLCSEQAKHHFKARASLSAVEVVIEVLGTRVDDIVTFYKQQHKQQQHKLPGSTEEEIAGFVMSRELLGMCSDVGERYEASENFVGAIRERYST